MCSVYCSCFFVFCVKTMRLLNVEAEQLFYELGGAEADLSLRHCLHLNVNICM